MFVKGTSKLALIVQLTRATGIARRYFVVNGFDGALTMLGMLVGFYHAELAGHTSAPLTVITSACVGAAIALGMSGLSSAYLSESAEQRAALQTLEAAMVTDLQSSAHGVAARLIPVVVALVNGLAPFGLSLLILLPLWVPPQVSTLVAALGFTPLETSMLLGLVVIFLLGAYLGRIGGHGWLWSGLRTLFIALLTGAIILLATPAGAAAWP